MQWVLGYQPHLPGQLVEDGLNPINTQPSERFQHKLNMQLQASKATLTADTDARLRRALLRQYKAKEPAPISIGSKVFYWRDTAGTGPKVRWKGPATVLMIENDLTNTGSSTSEQRQSMSGGPLRSQSPTSARTTCTTSSP